MQRLRSGVLAYEAGRRRCMCVSNALGAASPQREGIWARLSLCDRVSERAKTQGKRRRGMCRQRVAVAIGARNERWFLKFAFHSEGYTSVLRTTSSKTSKAMERRQRSQEPALVSPAWYLVGGEAIDCESGRVF